MKVYKETYTIESSNIYSETYHFDFGHNRIYGVGEYTAGFTDRRVFKTNMKRTKKRHPDHKLEEVSVEDVDAKLKRKLILYIMSRDEF